VSRTLWIVFALFIVYGTTIPFRFSTDPGAAAAKFAAVSWNPFVNATTGRRVSITDSVQNLMLFLPFGLLGALALDDRIRRTATRVATVTLMGAGLSTVVEAFQLFTVDRVASFSDVTTNTTGALLGASIAWPARRLFQQGLRRVVAAGMVDSVTFYPAMVATAVVAVAAWQPFDLTLDVSTVGRSVRALWRDPWQVGGFRDEGAALIHYVLFAAALSAWLQRRRVRHPALTAGAIGIAGALTLEASQFIVDSRMPSGLDAMVRVVGVGIGVVLWMGRGTSRSAWWIALLVAATAAGAAIQLLSPFDVAATRRPFSWLPMLGYYQNNWFPSVSHVIELVLLYFPLGFCLALVIPSARHALLATLGITLAICIPVEFFQGWIVGRYPDITDVAFSFCGGWLGVVAATGGAATFASAVARLRVTRLPETRRSA
jgi:glycopeptide antibiotics resistance protein